jgi:hypothetical protein
MYPVRLAGYAQATTYRSVLLLILMVIPNILNPTPDDTDEEHQQKDKDASSAGCTAASSPEDVETPKPSGISIPISCAPDLEVEFATSG